MAVTEKEFTEAEERMRAERQAGYALAARYDRRTARIVVGMNTGLELAFPPALAEGLADARPADLETIEINPAGLGLYWPKLDADLYIPALLQGVFGSRRWMAAELGAAGGRVRTNAKARSSRTNGRKGGGPRKTAANG
ncbi:MAG: DUF2442 domain-containing protein [Acetobacteraceae bacterium]